MSEWIRFTQKKLSEEEKAEKGYDFEIDCPIPKDGEEILVTIEGNWKGEKQRWVAKDTFYNDAGECFLDSGYDFITDVIAWMPLPEPYKEGEEE